jgi:uncharacterized membrane protein YGL010W
MSSNYNSFHTNSINKLIHTFCIPLIIISVLNFTSSFKINTDKQNKYTYKLGTKQLLNFTTYQCDSILLIFFSCYYFLYSVKTGTIMSVFLTFMYKLGQIWRRYDIHWKKNTIIVFIFAWVFQFIGHFIEGNKPALFTGLKMSIFQAPLYTVQSLLGFSIDE